jgi:hypothetical protein
MFEVISMNQEFLALDMTLTEATTAAAAISAALAGAVPFLRWVRSLVKKNAMVPEIALLPCIACAKDG